MVTDDDNREEEESEETVVEATSNSGRNVFNLLLGDENAQLQFSATDLDTLLEQIRAEMKLEAVGGIEYWRDPPVGEKEKTGGKWIRVEDISQMPKMAKIRLAAKSAPFTPSVPSQIYEVLVMDVLSGNRKKRISASSLSEFKENLRKALDLKQPIFHLEFCPDVSNPSHFIPLQHIEHLTLRPRVRIVHETTARTGGSRRPGGYTESALSPTLSLASLSPASHISSAFSSPASTFTTPSPSPPPNKFSLSSRPQTQLADQHHQLGSGGVRPPGQENDMVMLREYGEAMRSPGRAQNARAVPAGMGLMRHVGGGAGQSVATKNATSTSNGASGSSATLPDETPVVAPSSTRPSKVGAGGNSVGPQAAAVKHIWIQQEGASGVAMCWGTGHRGRFP